MTVPVVEYLTLSFLILGAWLTPRFFPNFLARIGDLVERIMHTRSTRLAVILVWWWLGWHFFTV